MGFSRHEYEAIVISERIASLFSMVGALFIIVTFIFTHRFRRPINRLAFYASFGNILANIGSVIARDGIKEMNKYGNNGTKTTPLCGFQAFLLQTFIPSDTLICLCMAINVYLSVIHKYSGPQLKKLEPIYVACSYGLPIIFGCMEFLPEVPGKGPLIGDAASWCWYTTKYDPRRIGLFYGPIWVILFITAVVYAVTGRAIFKLRHSLRVFAKTHRAHKSAAANLDSSTHLSSHAADRGTMSSPPPPPPTSGPGVAIQLSTVTHVTSSPRVPDPAHGGAMAGHGAITPDHMDNDISYKVTVETANGRQVDPEMGLDTVDTEFAEEELREIKQYEAAADAGQRPYPKQAPQVDLGALRSVETNPEAVRRTAAKAKHTLKANLAAWAYAKVSLLFFVAAMITWLPASLNRVYTVVHKDHNLFPLALLAGMTLSSQGFWNAIVYCVTSWTSCKGMWHDITKKVCKSRANIAHPHPVEKTNHQPPATSSFSSGSTDSKGKPMSV